MVQFLALLFCFPIQANAASMPKTPNGELYFATTAVTKNKCHGGKERSCISQIKNLNCRWPMEERSTYADCSYEGANGKTLHVNGRKARRLVNAVLSLNAVEIDGAAGSRGFSQALNLNCKENTVGRKKPSYACDVSTYSDSCLSQDQQKQLDHLKGKYEMARAKNPSCVSRRGAGACLSPREMLDMARLEREEEHGCRPAVQDSGFNRNQKPTMDAK